MKALAYIVVLVLAGVSAGSIPAGGDSAPLAPVAASDSFTPSPSDTTDHDEAGTDSTSESTSPEATPSEATSPNASAWQDDVWNEIAVVRGVQFAYLYYLEADTVNDGVVVRLHNRSRCIVIVDFDVIFRTASRERRERVVEEQYRLTPGERKTGHNDGLFYIPFPDGDSIAEVGLRGVSVRQSCP